MSTEPPLSHAALLERTRSAFGLDARSLTFIPDGTAPAYRVDGPSGRAFLKVLPDTPFGRETTARASAEVPLLNVLRGAAILPRVNRPIPARDGGFMANLDGHAVFAYDCIDAANLSGEWDAYGHEVAGLLGRLHAGTATITAAAPHLPVAPEDFGLPFETALQSDLQHLTQTPHDTRPGVQALRELLRPHIAAIEGLLERARRFQAAARSHPAPLVVCHTDAHGGNVMKDAAGELWIVDWETARLAPPEHDLWMLHAQLPEVLPAYRDGLGRAFTPNPDLLGFYLCRRPLEDLAVDIGWVLRENTRPDQDEHALEMMTRYSLPALLSAEADLERLHSGLTGG
ncbi:aminoglycoside phosphotransferase family protein [Deinococcus koreensis]|nr:aminoglycoside phosphotransferase family protein [Deinococcus koreensis]